MKLSYFISFLILIILASCQKDPLSRPTKVSFVFGMQDYSIRDDSDKKTFMYTGKSFSQSDKSLNTDGSIIDKASNNGILVIDRGSLIISSIEFEGRREQGEDVYFSSNLGQKIIADLGAMTTNIPVSFDIPQGVYHHIEITLNLGTDGQAPLIMEGNLQRGPLQDTPIRFEYPFTERIRIIGKGKHQQNIVLHEDKLSVARVEINAESLFRLVNMGMIMTASTINQGGQDIIIINHQNNLPVFNMIANRLANAFTLSID
jgi:hypothetical protein